MVGDHLCLLLDRVGSQDGKGRHPCPITLPASQTIDHLAPGHSQKPPLRPVRYSAATPVLYRSRESVLQGVLRQLEVTKAGDEGGKTPPPVVAHHPVKRGAGKDGLAHPKTTMGRTSMVPYFAPGICAAHFSASSRSAQSSR